MRITQLLHTPVTPYGPLSVTYTHKKLSLCWQTCATRFAVSRGRQTWYHCGYFATAIWNGTMRPSNSTDWLFFLLVFYRNFVPKTHRFGISTFEKYRDHETGVTGYGRSLKMTLFDTPSTISCWCSIVTMSLSRVVYEIFNVEKYRDLEIPVTGPSRSLKVVPFCGGYGRHCSTIVQ